MRKVFIGVGHGGSDPGACANGLRECDVNLEMALAMKAELERHGVTVGISRVKDENDRLAEEIRECNAFAPELAVEVHNNAGGGDGFECFVNGRDRTARRLAERIEAEVKKIGQNSRGREGQYRLGVGQQGEGSRRAVRRVLFGFGGSQGRRYCRETAALRAGLRAGRAGAAWDYCEGAGAARRAHRPQGRAGKVWVR